MCTPKIINQLLNKSYDNSLYLTTSYVNETIQHRREYHERCIGHTKIDMHQVLSRIFSAKPISVDMKKTRAVNTARV
ncbi:conserved hypothetical protein [Klebsiella variicola]|nr:conserved hypothetical protein [Klebsiella variicola]